MKKNIPDRVKLILQFSVFTVFTMLIFGVATVMLVTIHPNLYIYQNYILLGTVTITILIHGGIFIYRWKKLIKKERSGDLTDMQDIRNITTRQLFFVLTGIPVFFSSIILIKCNRPVGFLGIVLYLILWAGEVAYQRKRQKKIIEDRESVAKGQSPI